jgi:hypothetical protein
MWDSWSLLAGFLPWQILVGILALGVFFFLLVLVGLLLSQCILINGGIVGVEPGSIV